MEARLEYDADEGYLLILTSEGGEEIECPPHRNVPERAIRSAEQIVEAMTKIKDRVWQGYEADGVEDAEMAMLTRQNWQMATNHLLDLFQIPPGDQT